MKDVFEAIREVAASGRRGALATVVTTRGSTPGKTAMKLVVSADGSAAGSVGGGCLEASVADAARQVIDGADAHILTLHLTEKSVEDLGLICGGSVDVFVQPLGPDPVWNEAVALRARAERGALVTRITGDAADGRLALIDAGGLLLAGDPALASEAGAGPSRRTIAWSGEEHEIFVEPLATPAVWIFGGGHVSLALARVASAAGFRVGIVDDRPEFSGPERFPMAFATVCGEFPACLDEISVNHADSLVIVTRQHASDEDVLRWAVEQPVRSIGMIGSRRKIRTTFDRLRADGVPEETLRRIRAPIGLDIGAQTSDEIAVAIAAELIAIHRVDPDDLSVGRPLRSRRGPFASE
jgi:xanthine dehydrogenase accessory factor